MADDQSQPLRFCRSCLYALRIGESRRCPECGKEFDPNDPRTTLAFPHFEHWDHLAAVTILLIRLSVVLAIVSFVLCMLSCDRPRAWHFLSCGFGVGLVAVTTTLAAIPKVPLRRRQRICGLICPFLFASIDFTHWPLLASVYVCPPWMNMMADQATLRDAMRVNTGVSPGPFRGGRTWGASNVGFELLANDNGGIMLVRSSGHSAWLGPNRVWRNTNWEVPLVGEWHLVLED